MPLIHEEIYEYKGYHGCDSRCRIRVYELPGGALVIVASDLEGELAHLGENHGTSITNMAEHLATAWRQRYRGRPIVWVEHYPAHGCCWERNGQTVWQFGETFDRVRFTWDNKRQCYRKPAWMHLGRAGAEKLIGEAWPEPMALDEDTYYKRRDS
jgi:hypothetical protein